MRQNQTVIVKHFNLNRKAFCDSLLELKKEQERYLTINQNSFHTNELTQLNCAYHRQESNNIQLLFLRESLLLYAEDSDHDLQVFLKVIGLLAACCEGGNNLFIESICQSIISVNELMKVLMTTYILLN